jgi:hypothetical protein
MIFQSTKGEEPHTMKRSRKTITVALVAGLSLIAAACGDDEETAPAETSGEPTTTAGDTATTGATDTTQGGTDTSEAAETTVAAGGGDGACPSNLVIQTDWWPELEHGGTYQLIGPEGTADKSNFRYSGPIAEAYKVGGIETVEIRAGGDATSFTPNATLLETDDDITFAYINLSDVFADAARVPMVAVAKTLDQDPQMLMWDPTQLEINAPADIATSGADVLHFDGVAYIDYLISKGDMNADQSNPSYGGAPDTWVAQGGNFIQQGFSTNEVYKYENDIAWKDGAPAPVKYFTVKEMGFDNYAAAMVIRADKKEALDACLKELVPAMSQAWVDFLADPQPITDALISINETYDTYWKLSEGLNTKGLEILEEKGIGADSPDGTYCSFDAARAETLFGIMTDVNEAKGVDSVAAPTDAYTNEYCEGAPGRS